MIDFSRDVCADLGVALGREWLETNGLGGYASSTIAGANTRRYHGLLVAATRPPVGRLVMLSKLEETLVVDGVRHDLSTNQYPGTVHPRGYALLERFRLDPFPIATYRVDGIEVERSVFMVHGRNATVVQYELRGHEGREVSLEVRPLVAVRDYHALGRERADADLSIERGEGSVTIAPYEGLPALHLAHDADSVDETAFWFRDFEYERERERGFDHREDLASPCALSFDLSGRSSATVIASLEPVGVERAADLREAEIARRDLLASRVNAGGIAADLARAADHYAVARGQNMSVIAGYHWFSDWGRDTMISLPGLTLVTGRFGVARSVLREFAGHVDRGMLPNRFPDEGDEPEYNNVDSTLWFFEAIRALLAYTGDYDFVRTHLYSTLTGIIGWHERGTRYGIRVDRDGLLTSGAEGVQLTWMDARVGDWVVTPRRGKAVEIQALWYNALRVMEGLAARFGDEEGLERYAALADRAEASFAPLFWNEGAGCLYDAVEGDARDGSIRPNQILAVSLTHSMLDAERSRRVVEVVERDLLTPRGLRSLAPGDPSYCPRYEGDSTARDGSYHQGTVWGWLLGPFVTAYVKVNGASAQARERAGALLEGLRPHLEEAGLGHVSEIFDAEAPHTPRGCIAQAWSVAEALRAAVEDLAPPTERPGGATGSLLGQ